MACIQDFKLGVSVGGGPGGPSGFEAKIFTHAGCG